MKQRMGLCAALLLCLLGAGCVSVTSGTALETDASRSSLVPQPLRSIGLVLHRLAFATGLYALTDRVGGDDEPVKLDRKESGGKRGPLAVTWFGHSTVLLTIGKTTILTDPVLAGEVSLWSPLPVFYGAAALQLEQLPEIDLVVLSHGDYDHLHQPSLQALAKRFPNADIVVPESLEHLVSSDGFRQVHALAVNQSVRVGDIEVTGLPVVHATRRNIFGFHDGAALSWEFRSRRKSVLFIGDTAYHDVFSEIGRKRGPYSLVLVPIGASEPRHFVGDMHISPEDAVRLAKDVRAKVAVGIHWGMFALSPEPRGEPARRFRLAGEGRATALTLPLGKTINLR